MTYRCPMCLHPLDFDSRLYRLCPGHNEFEGTEATFEGPFRFQGIDNCYHREEGTGERCKQNHRVQSPLVWLCHEGCPIQSPFWDGTARQLTFPKGDFTLLVPSAGGTKSQKVNHWQLRVFELQRALTTRFPHLASRSEMWFPLALLRATGDEDGTRCGAIVELSGSADVGKTVLAMQAMDWDGYVPANLKNLKRQLKRHIDVSGFLAIPAEAGVATVYEEFLRWLHLQTLLSSNHAPPPGLWGGTKRIHGQVKAAFFRPGRPPKSESESGFRQVLLGLWSELVQLVSADEEAYNTVIFYDTAGEMTDEANHNYLMQLDQAADVVAVLIDANDLTTSPHKSLEGAIRRLDELRQPGNPDRRCCLIVTKIDQVLGTRRAEYQACLEAAENPTVNTEHFRKQLLLWLDRAGNDRCSRLASLVRSEDSLVNEVFFVWTNDWGTDRPYSNGLAKFICWCLGLSPHRIG